MSSAQRRKPSRLAILVRPEPSKSSCGQQGEDESVEGFLQSHAPWLALPDGVAQISQAISQKPRRADHAEHGGISGTGRNGVRGEIRDEEADDEAIAEPQSEKLRHVRRATGVNGQKAHGSLLEFFLDCGRLHGLVGAKRKVVKTPRKTNTSQRGENAVLVGKRMVVAAVVRQNPVHDGAGDKDDDCGEQDREPECGERDHRGRLLWMGKRFSVRGYSGLEVRSRKRPWRAREVAVRIIHTQTPGERQFFAVFL